MDWSWPLLVGGQYFISYQQLLYVFLAWFPLQPCLLSAGTIVCTYLQLQLFMYSCQPFRPMSLSHQHQWYSATDFSSVESSCHLSTVRSTLLDFRTQNCRRRAGTNYCQRKEKQRWELPGQHPGPWPKSSLSVRLCAFLYLCLVIFPGQNWFSFPSLNSASLWCPRPPSGSSSLRACISFPTHGATSLWAPGPWQASSHYSLYNRLTAYSS